MNPANENNSASVTAPPVKNPILSRLILPAAFACVFLYDMLTWLVISLAKERPIDWREETLESLLFWGLWLLLAPLMMRFARRYPLERHRLLPTAVYHLIVFAFVASFQYSFYLLLEHWLIQGIPLQALPGLFPRHTSVLIGGIFRNVYFYWIILGTYYAVLYSLKFRERQRAAADLEIKASQLEARLAVARLETLRMQLQPHFLFNTLNTISVLMKEDVDKANRMLLRLSELLRASLEEMSGDFVPLEQELAFLEKYLEIEQVRFEDRLHVDIRVDDGLLVAEVPNLFLQPIVENAVRHGISRSSVAGRLTVGVERSGDQLRIEVLDDGPGLGDAGLEALQRKGIGIANTIKRLEQLYGDDFSFSIESREPAGARVLIVIPFRTSA